MKTKRIVSVVVALLLIAGIAYFIVESRNRGELLTETFSGVNSIEVSTALNEVVVRESSGDQVTMSITGQDNPGFYALEDGVLRIRIGVDTDPGFKISINNKEHQPLYLDVPSGMLDSLSIQTVMGNVTISDVLVGSLSADIDSGDIHMEGVPGMYEIAVASGKLESSVIDVDTVQRVQGGAYFTGAVGQGDNPVYLATGIGTVRVD